MTFDETLARVLEVLQRSEDVSTWTKSISKT